MNFGTKLRTALRIAASANTAVYAVTAAVAAFNSPIVATVWAVITIISDFAVAFLTTYFNNDYTPIAAEKTGELRLIGSSNKFSYFKTVSIETFISFAISSNCLVI